jgi:hypothetical protein
VILRATSILNCDGQGPALPEEKTPKLVRSDYR